MNKRDISSAFYRYAVRFNAQNSDHKLNRLGAFGPASSVRRIDPTTGKVIEVLSHATTTAGPCSADAGHLRPFRSG